MVRINNDVKTYKAPYQVVVMDALDAYYYADIYDDGRMTLYATLEDLKKVKALADAIFVVKNYRFESLADMNELDSGWDVRVFDSDSTCVHAAHQTFQKKWIGE